MSLDRFAYGPPDPQNEKPIGYCDACGGEIYRGEQVYVSQMGVCHSTISCLSVLLDVYLMDAEDCFMEGVSLW
ncbi:hypothetical protein E308F_30340 [Moorella sp. E308F]|uniref:hypothetical protein n=1 Tax=Moorella sp. E308F TaxID=2572682 RepID=UPI0010FFBF0A|nr:hypothetical protein [Moorella sp. E308F]GEA16788.1 hypothetical protein E308F_30340 [Moorella sp. E308F]